MLTTDIMREALAAIAHAEPQWYGAKGEFTGLSYAGFAAQLQAIAARAIGEEPPAEHRFVPAGQQRLFETGRERA